MIKSVLGSGAAVRVLVRSPLPSPQYYLIERIFPGRTRIWNQSGDLLQNVSPQSVLGNIEVYGQHGVSELTRYPEKLAQLLRRFTELEASGAVAKAQLKEQLERSRSAIDTEITEIERIEQALAALPSLKEHLKRFAAAGLDEKLKDKTLIDEEKRPFEHASEVVEEAESLADDVLAAAESDGALVGDDSKKLPNGAILSKLDAVQTKLLQKIKAAGKSIEAAATEASAAIAKIAAEWTPKQKAAEGEYQQTLKKLRAEGHDAAKFVSYKDQVDRLKPKETELKVRKRTLGQHQLTRRDLLAKWDGAKAEDFRELQRAAQRVSKRLKDRVRLSPYLVMRSRSSALRQLSRPASSMRQLPTSCAARYSCSQESR